MTQDHLASLQGLQKLVDSVIDSNSHPHAVDGDGLQRIKAAATHDSTDAGALESATTCSSPAAGIDIVQLLEVSSAILTCIEYCVTDHCVHSTSVVKEAHTVLVRYWHVCCLEHMMPVVPQYL